MQRYITPDRIIGIQGPATEIYRVLKLCLDSLSSRVIGDISNTFQPTRQETKGKSSQTEKSLMAKQSGGRE